MRPVVKTYVDVSAGALPPVLLDHHVAYQLVQYAVVVSGDSPQYNVQYTIGNLVKTSAEGVDWLDEVSAKNASFGATLGGPATGLRLNIVSAGASANVSFQVLQTGN